MGLPCNRLHRKTGFVRQRLPIIESSHLWLATALPYDPSSTRPLSLCLELLTAGPSSSHDIDRLWDTTSVDCDKTGGEYWVTTGSSYLLVSLPLANYSHLRANQENRGVELHRPEISLDVLPTPDRRAIFANLSARCLSSTMILLQSTRSTDCPPAETTLRLEPPLSQHYHTGNSQKACSRRVARTRFPNTQSSCCTTSPAALDPDLVPDHHQGYAARTVSYICFGSFPVATHEALDTRDPRHAFEDQSAAVSLRYPPPNSLKSNPVKEFISPPTFDRSSSFFNYFSSSMVTSQ